MGLLLRLLLIVTFIECLTAGQNLGDNSISEHSVDDTSNFKKFLNLFGLGTSKQFPPNNHHVPEFNPYSYPCAMSTTTTTTPAPVVLSPLLCPFPPMMPAHHKPQGDGEYQQPHIPHPGGLDNLPFSPLPPGSSDSLRPPPHFPVQFPQNPGHQSPIFIPIQPGQNPQFPYPGQSVPPYPGQNIPNPYPIQNLPNPVQPSQGPGGPGPFSPHENPQPSLPSLLKPDPLNPEDPVKVNPVVTNPHDPVKVTPTIVDPTKPIHVSPVDIKPSQPVLVDPATIQPGQPLVVDPLKAPPSLTTGSLLAPPSFSDPKAFSKYPAVSPFGPANVLINPGFPELLPTSTPRPANVLINLGLPEKPYSPHVRPSNVLINPGLPVYPPPPPQGPNSSNPQLINPGFPLKPFYPTNTMLHPDNVHLIPLVPVQVFPNRPPFGGNPFLTIPPPPSGDNLGNMTLPPPPPLYNASLPPPPPLYDNPPMVPSPSTNDPIAAPPLDGSYYPTGMPPTSSQLPPLLPLAPGMVLPEHSRPPCGHPFLKPYVPTGFHLSSVNQFIGVPPVTNPRFNYPCPTLDMLQTLDFKIMRSLIVSSGLYPLFEHTKNYTLFLPSDAAFRRLPRWFRDSLDVDKKLKKALLLNHLVKEDLPLSVLENEELVLSARPGGNRLRINIYEPDNTYRTITVDGAEVEKGDILTSNGRLHIVNKVLMPNLPRNAAQFLSEKLEFESFWNLVKQADLVQNFQDLRPFTLFIPVNDAVQRLNDSAFLSDRDKLRNFINYHMVNGTYYSSGMINNEFLLTNYEKEIKMQVTSDTFARHLAGINGRVKVLKADITLTNGVAHVVDQCISDETPFYVYPQSDEFKNEYGVLRRNFRVTGQEKNIENAF